MTITKPGLYYYNYKRPEAIANSYVVITEPIDAYGHSADEHIYWNMPHFPVPVGRDSGISRHLRYICSIEEAEDLYPELLL